MNKKVLLFLPLLGILIASCSRGSNPSTSSVTSSTGIPSTTSSFSTSSSTSSSSKTSSSITTSSSKTTSSSSSTTSPVPTQISIEEANLLGYSYSQFVPVGGHEYFGEIITTSGRAIQNIAIGLNQSGLTYICDGTSMIPCLGGTGNNTLYQKCSDYIGLDTSNYVVTGQIGYYYSMPCIKITSFVLNQSMKFEIDYKLLNYEEYSSVNSYNDFLLDVDYNKKGYGESHLVKLTNMKCIAKADNNSWLVTDGNHVQGVYYQTSNTALNIGSQYDLYGISCLYKWKPSLRILIHEISKGSEIILDIENVSSQKTALQMYSIGCPKDDTEKSNVTNEFVKTFKYFYKSDLYFNYYQSNNNCYVVAGDNYYSSPISSQLSAKNNKMFLFNNPSYNKWQTTTYVPVANYLLQEVALTSYYVEYQFTKNDGVMMPQVYMLEDFIPKT